MADLTDEEMLGIIQSLHDEMWEGWNANHFAAYRSAIAALTANWGVYLESNADGKMLIRRQPTAPTRVEFWRCSTPGAARSKPNKGWQRCPTSDACRTRGCQRLNR